MKVVKGDLGSGFNRSKVQEYMSTGKAAAKRKNIIDVWEGGDRRSSRMIAIDEVERLR